MNAPVKYLMKYFTISLVTILVAAACSPKKAVLWQGQYVSISTIEKPKEDFKVGKYVVVSYADKYSFVPYKFVITINAKQVGFITLNYHEELEDLGFQYVLQEEGVKREVPMSYLKRFGNRIIYQLYKNLPEYEKMKEDVIAVLSGIRLVPPE